MNAEHTGLTRWRSHCISVAPFVVQHRLDDMAEGRLVTLEQAIEYWLAGTTD